MTNFSPLSGLRNHPMLGRVIGLPYATMHALRASIPGYRSPADLQTLAASIRSHSVKPAVGLNARNIQHRSN
jgi:hypothetical protein